MRTTGIGYGTATLLLIAALHFQTYVIAVQEPALTCEADPTDLPPCTDRVILPDTIPEPPTIASTTTLSPPTSTTEPQIDTCPTCKSICEEERSKCDMSEIHFVSKSVIEVQQLKIQSDTRTHASDSIHGEKDGRGRPRIIFDVLMPGRRSDQHPSHASHQFQNPKFGHPSYREEIMHQEPGFQVRSQFELFHPQRNRIDEQEVHRAEIMQRHQESHRDQQLQHEEALRHQQQPQHEEALRRQQQLQHEEALRREQQFEHEETLRNQQQLQHEETLRREQELNREQILQEEEQLRRDQERLREEEQRHREISHALRQAHHNQHLTQQDEPSQENRNMQTFQDRLQYRGNEKHVQPGHPHANQRQSLTRSQPQHRLLDWDDRFRRRQVHHLNYNLM